MLPYEMGRMGHTLCFYYQVNDSTIVYSSQQHLYMEECECLGIEPVVWSRRLQNQKEDIQCYLMVYQHYTMVRHTGQSYSSHTQEAGSD